MVRWLPQNRKKRLKRLVMSYLSLAACRINADVTTLGYLLPEHIHGIRLGDADHVKSYMMMRGSHSV